MSGMRLFKQGAVTGVVAVIGFFLLPDTPLTTTWLTPDERQLAHTRMELNTVGNQGDSSTSQGLKQATVDPMVWIFAIMARMHLAANVFKNFFPTIVQTLGFNQTITLALTCPPYLIAGAITMLSPGPLAIATIGFLVACFVPTSNTVGRYLAMIVFTIGTYGVNSLILGWTGSTCGQTKEKKAAAMGIVTTIMNISFIWTPYLWPKSDAPKYQIALASSAGFSVATALMAWIAKI